MGGEGVLLALAQGLQECCPAHRRRRIGGGGKVGASVIICPLGQQGGGLQYFPSPFIWP
jgi:hypothetical protein